MNSSPSLASFESPLSGRSCIQSSKQNIVYHTCLASPPFRTAYHGGVRIRWLSVFHFNYFLVVKSILYFLNFFLLLYCITTDTAQLYVRHLKTHCTRKYIVRTARVGLTDTGYPSGSLFRVPIRDLLRKWVPKRSLFCWKGP